MVKVVKPYILVILLLLLLAFLRIAPPSSMTIKDEMSPFFKTFPLQIGDWKGTDTPPDEKTLEILETRNVLSREYVDSQDHKIDLLLVSSQKDRRVAHPPEVCYLGSNFNIVEERETPIAIGDPSKNDSVMVKEFKAINERSPQNQQEVLYLYRVGSRFTTNYYAQQLQFAVDKLTRDNSEVLLIRLAGNDREAVRNFLQDLLPVLNTQK